MKRIIFTLSLLLTAVMSWAAGECFTITFNAGTGTCSTASLTQETAGASVILPSCTIGEGWEFLGWSTVRIGECNTMPNDLLLGSYKPTANVTLYAVYMKFEKWQKITNMTSVTQGIYAIINQAGYAFNGVISNKDGGTGGVTTASFAFNSEGNASSAPEGTCELIFAQKDNNANRFSIYAQGKGYFEAGAAKTGSLIWWSSTESSYWNNSGSAWIYNQTSAYLGYNTEKSSFDSFSNGTFYSTNNAIQFAQKICTFNSLPSVEQTLNLVAQNTSGYWATFSRDYDVKFTDDATTVYTVNVNNNSLQLNEVAKKQIPANTGVLIKTAGTTATYSSIASATALENNLLKPATGATTVGDGCYFYKLAYGDWGNKTDLGFYWGAENGAPFTAKAGGAYLAVPTSDVHFAKSFVFGDTDADGIETLNVDANLNGKYLENGRLVIIRNGVKYNMNGQIIK